MVWQERGRDVTLGEAFSVLGIEIEHLTIDTLGLSVRG